mmetsp:Transcript_95559/g.206186  ORF Transcript_95559/g.206186 Transcript_95559/m.206186 type:complete len:126 (-) Transcript_95559:162-539(-)
MPFNIFPMRNLLLSAVYGLDVQDVDKATTFQIVTLSLLCNAICLGLSIITSHVDDVMTIVGDTLNVFMCFMIPCIYYYLVNKIVLKRKLSDPKNIVPISICALTGTCGLVSLALFIIGKFVTLPQ